MSAKPAMQKIYLMRNALGLHKIGISSNPKTRAMAISNMSGVKVKLIHVWDSYQAFNTEQKLHYHFSKKRKLGEWFDLTEKDVESIPMIIKSIDHLIDCVEAYDEFAEVPIPVCEDMVKFWKKWSDIEFINPRHPAFARD